MTKAEQLINEAGQKVLDWMEATEGFAVEQAPLLAQEIVRWGVWFNGSILLLCYCISLVVGITAWRLGTTKDVWDTEPTVRAVGCIILGIVSVMTWIISTTECLPDLIKALIAPRLYILEQIGGILG